MTWNQAVKMTFPLHLSVGVAPHAVSCEVSTRPYLLNALPRVLNVAKLDKSSLLAGSHIFLHILQ